MSNPLHSNLTAEWYTPLDIIERVRYTLGDITTDPCSNAIANEVVGATFFYDASDNGLALTWAGATYVNPPSKCESCYGRCSCKLPRKFMHRMFEQYYTGPVTHAIYLGFNLGQLKYLEDMEFHSDDVRFVVPRKRIKFWKPGSEKNNPTQDNFVLLLSSDLAVRTRFDETFGEIGQVYQTV